MFIQGIEDTLDEHDDIERNLRERQKLEAEINQSSFYYEKLLFVLFNRFFRLFDRLSISCVSRLRKGCRTSEMKTKTCQQNPEL